MQDKFALWHLRICLGAVALMLTVPFLMPYHYNPIPTFFQEWTAAALSLVALTWLLRNTAQQPLELPQIGLLPLGLLLVAVAQFIFLPDVLTDRLMMLGLYLIWALLIVMLGRRLAVAYGLEALADLMATALVIGALLQALSGGAQLAGVARLPLAFPHIGGGVRGNLAQPNNFADYLWLGIAATIYLRSRGWLGLTATIGTLIILIPFSVLSGSRSIWAYSLALVILSALPPLRKTAGGHSLLRWSLITLLGALAFQGIASLDWAAIPGAAHSSGARLADSTSSDPIRTTLWEVAWRVFLEHPWLGAGFGQFTQQYHLHVLDLMPRHLPGLGENAHNIVLHVLCEMGLAGALLLVLTTLRWLWQGLQTQTTPVTWWLLATIGILGIHSNLEYPLWYAFFLALAALTLGMGSTRQIPLELSRLAPLVLAAFIGLGAFALWNLRSDYSLLEDTLNGRLPVRAPEDYQKSAQAALEQLAAQSLLRPYIDLAAANLISDDGDNLEDKLATCQRAQHFSASRDIVFKCALLLARAGDQQAADLALKRAVAAYPDHAERVLRSWEERGKKDPVINGLVKTFPPIIRAGAIIAAGAVPPAPPVPR